MQTKQSVTNSNNCQPSAACGEKHAAIKLPIRSTVIAALGLLSSLLPVSQTAHAQDETNLTSAAAVAAPVVFQAAGPTAASIQSTVDQFRAALGVVNNLNNPGPLTSGRREINWDGGNPAITDTTPPVTPFTGFVNIRGAQFTTPGVGLSQATPSGLAVLFNNPTYANIFGTFSPSRLFTPVHSNVTNALFSVPGTNGAAAATVTGFGAVFTDVDEQGRLRVEPGGKTVKAGTRIEYFDRAGKLILSHLVPASPGSGSLSFFGIILNDARIAAVRIVSDSAPGGNDDLKRDIVMMDDFIYGEPQLVQ